MTSVTNGTITATYSYWPKSLLTSNVVFKQGNNERMTTTRTYDGLNRLTQISSTAGANTFRYGYAYDLANQRISLTNADDSRWTFNYDDLGQLTNASKAWSDEISVAGQQFSFDFDDIGNRKWALRDGRREDYSATLLNQYNNRTVPGYANVIGDADSTSTVKINGKTSERKGSYYRKELQFANASGAKWVGITNVAIKPNGSEETYGTNIGSIYVPPATETFLYDGDGNLTNDGRWLLIWDAENRLVSAETTSSAVAGGVPKQKIQFQYDWRSRRISKTVSNYVAGSWTLALDIRFVYNGWNLIAVLDSSRNIQSSYVWGNDLSGTMQGAGGVGGLLMANTNSTSIATYFPAFDGNGNVMAYLSATDSQIVAQYEYSPFSELIRATGPLAKNFSILFSTKYYDWETGFVYFNFRYYNPSTGRWLSRDRIEEQGGVNLYGFTDNDLINCIDVIGFNKYFTSIRKYNPPTKRPKVTPQKPPKNVKYPKGGPGNGEKENALPPSQDNPATPADYPPEALNFPEIIFTIINKKLENEWKAIGKEQCRKSPYGIPGGCKCCVVVLSGRESLIDSSKIWCQASGYVVNMSCESKKAMDNDPNRATLSSYHGPRTIDEKYYYNSW